MGVLDLISDAIKFEKYLNGFLLCERYDKKLIAALSLSLRFISTENTRASSEFSTHAYTCSSLVPDRRFQRTYQTEVEQ